MNVATRLASGAIKWLLFCAAVWLGFGPGPLAAEPQTATGIEWKSQTGNWTEAGRWSGGVPNAFQEVVIGGTSRVTIPPGVYLAGDLEVGRTSGDRVRVEVAGGQVVLLQDSLFVGEYTDSESEFVLREGALHCVMDVFVGAATAAPKRANRATLRVLGGSFLGRNLTIGLGFGARSRVSIEGSRATAVHVFDYCYVEASTAPDGTPGDTTLAFTLDQNGVTPITIQSMRDGLRIIKDATSRCRLEVTLSAVPPRGDVTLVAGHRATKGTFDGLAEGAEVTAEFERHTYRWALTYRGGTSGCDLVLQNRSEYLPGAAVTKARAIPAVPVPLWTEHPLVFPLEPVGGSPAFAGAEGFGAATRGGSGGRNIFVDTLDDAGTGSLRAALAEAGPRKIVFRVGGVIRLQTQIVVREPWVTLDGQDAPAPGITLRGHGLEVCTHDVVLRHFRVRIGDDEVRLDDVNRNYASGVGDYALYFVEGAGNCIADHLSLSWTTNKILSTTKMSDRITVQWCILSEALNFSAHGYASISGGNRVTWHHNLFAHNLSRNVRFQGAVQADFRNNVIYDWGDAAAYGEFDRLNYVGNYLKAGPSTKQSPPLFHSGDRVIGAHTLFAADNQMEGNAAVNQDNWRGLGYFYERATVAASAPFPSPPVTTDAAAVAYERVLAEAGATLPRRDAVDARVVREVREGKGRIIDHVADVGGWPESPAASK